MFFRSENIWVIKYKISFRGRDDVNETFWKHPDTGNETFSAHGNNGTFVKHRIYPKLVFVVRLYPVEWSSGGIGLIWDLLFCYRKFANQIIFI